MFWFNSFIKDKNVVVVGVAWILSLGLGVLSGLIQY